MRIVAWLLGAWRIYVGFGATFLACGWLAHRFTELANSPEYGAAAGILSSLVAVVWHETRERD